MDFLTNERFFLPVHVISVRLSATIFAFELGEWEGVVIPESEHEVYLHPPTEGDEIRCTTASHSWANLELSAAWCRIRDPIESLLCRSIDAGRLKVLTERRDLTGAINPVETLLDVDAVHDWAELHGLEVGDLFRDYVEVENGLAMTAMSRIEDDRWRLESPAEHAQVTTRALGLDASEVVELLRENARLRTQADERQRQEMSLDTRQRATLLTIIGALAKEASLDLSKPYKAGETISIILSHEHDVTLSARTIGDHLKMVPDALERRKSK